MNDHHKKLLKAAWEDWHAGTGMDVDDMPPANPSFKAGFNAGLVAAHESYCKALVKIDALQNACLDEAAERLQELLRRANG